MDPRTADEQLLATFRPDTGGLPRVAAGQGWRIAANLALIVAMAIVLGHFVGASTAVLSVIAILALVALAGLAILVLYESNARVDLFPTIVRVTNSLNRTQTIARSEVAQVVRVTVRGFEATWELGVAVDSSDRCLFSLYSSYDLARIAAAIGVPLTGSFDEVLRSTELSKRYPGALPWYYSARIIGPLTFVGALVAGITAYFVWQLLR